MNGLECRQPRRGMGTTKQIDWGLTPPPKALCRHDSIALQRAVSLGPAAPDGPLAQRPHVISPDRCLGERMLRRCTAPLGALKSVWLCLMVCGHAASVRVGPGAADLRRAGQLV